MASLPRLTCFVAWTIKLSKIGHSAECTVLLLDLGCHLGIPDCWVTFWCNFGLSTWDKSVPARPARAAFEYRDSIQNPMASLRSLGKEQLEHDERRSYLKLLYFESSPPWHTILTQFLTYHLELYMAYIIIYMYILIFYLTFQQPSFPVLSKRIKGVGDSFIFYSDCFGVCLRSSCTSVEVLLMVAYAGIAPRCQDDSWPYMFKLSIIFSAV